MSLRLSAVAELPLGATRYRTAWGVWRVNAKAIA
jgi:hypothetical protein